jgi:hypothetical protein
MSDPVRRGWSGLNPTIPDPSAMPTSGSTCRTSTPPRSSSRTSWTPIERLVVVGPSELVPQADRGSGRQLPPAPDSVETVEARGYTRVESRPSRTPASTMRPASWTPQAIECCSTMRWRRSAGTVQPSLSGCAPQSPSHGPRRSRPTSPARPLGPGVVSLAPKHDKSADAARMAA